MARGGEGSLPACSLQPRQGCLGSTTHRPRSKPGARCIMVNLEQLRRDMFARSFAPRQWFEEREWEDPIAISEDKIMWVYIKSASDLWQVGFYDPNKVWHAESGHPTPADAAERVHWLNGGNQRG